MCVDGDAVTLLNEGNVAASRRFGRHVTDHHAPCATRETTIGDQPHAFAQTRTNQGACGGQHFGHTRATFGTQVTQHHHIAGHDLARQNGFEGRLLVVKHAGWAGDDRILETGDLGHGAFWRQIALQDGQVPLLVHGLFDGVDDAFVGRGIGHVFQNLGNGLARDRDAVAMQQARIEQNLHHLWDAASLMQVNGQGFATGFEVAQHRRTLADALEVINAPLDTGAVGNGQEVQNCVG